MNDFGKTFVDVSRLLLGVIAAGGLVSCQGEADDVWSPEPEPELLEELRVPATLPLLPSGDGGSYAAARATAGGESSDVDIGIAGGHIELWATSDGLLVINELQVDAADVVIAAEAIPPVGVHLTGLRARLVGPVAVVPSVRGDRLTAIARLSLTVDWGLVVGDQVHPLNPLRLDDLPFSVEVEQTAAGLSARLVAFRDGRFWAFADLWELADLTLDLFAVD